MAKGGKRPGAGRKPHKLKGLMKYMPGDMAAAVLAEINANQMWIDLAKSKDERVRLDTLKYLTDRAYGKAKQAIEVGGEDGGPIEHCIRFISAKHDS